MEHDLLILGYGALTVSGIAFVAVIVREVRAQMSAFESVQSSMTNARPWPSERDPDSDGINPWEDERVQGMWHGLAAKVAMDIHGAHCEVTLSHWPSL